MIICVYIVYTLEHQAGNERNAHRGHLPADTFAGTRQQRRATTNAQAHPRATSACARSVPCIGASTSRYAEALPLCRGLAESLTFLDGGTANSCHLGMVCFKPHLGEAGSCIRACAETPIGLSSGDPCRFLTFLLNSKVLRTLLRCKPHRSMHRVIKQLPVS